MLMPNAPSESTAPTSSGSAGIPADPAIFDPSDTAPAVLRLLSPVLALLLVGVMAIAGLLLLISHAQDRAAAQHSVRMVETSLNQVRARLGLLVHHYATWHEGLDHLGRQSTETTGADAMLVLGGDDRTLVVYQDGKRMDPKAAVPGEGILALAREARRISPDQPRASTGFAFHDGQPGVVAAALIRSDMGTDGISPGDVLIIVRRFDNALLSEVATPLLLVGLRIAGQGEDLPITALRLSDPTGLSISALTWKAQAASHTLLDGVEGLLLAAIIAMVALTTLFLARAQRIMAEREQTAVALRRSEERYRRLVEAMPDLVGLLRDGRLALLNAGGAKLLGASGPESLLDRPFSDLVAETERDAFQQHLEHPGEPRQATWYAHTLRSVDGRPVPVNLAFLPVDDGAGAALMIVARDLSAQTLAQERIRNAEAQAEAADRAKGQFLANITHELRTPLNAIIGFSEILRDELLGSLGSPQYREYAIDIHEGGLQLLRLVNDLLDLARIDAGRLELREAWIDVPTLVDRCWRLVQQRAGDHGVTLIVNVAPMGRRLLADEMRLKQVLVNLLTNAIRFSEPGGQVELLAEVDEAGSFLFRVIDHGRGMSEEDIKLALEPFGQVEAGHNRRQPGAGLGLPLAKGYVEAHGGGLSISSAPGQGTTVTVMLPRSRLYPATGVVPAPVS